MYVKHTGEKWKNTYNMPVLKNALESFPELTIITRDSKAKNGGSAISKIKMCQI